MQEPESISPEPAAHSPEPVAQIAPEAAPEPTKPEIPAEEPTPMLDVHPAHHAATSWKEFLVHIATIVLGLLIAVGLEQLVLYFEHRHQVAETRKALAVERKQNVIRFAGETEELHRSIPIFLTDIAIFEYLKAHPGARPESWPGKIHGQVYSTAYSDAAWKTAQQGQVLGFMPAAEVEEDAMVYGYLGRLGEIEGARYDAMAEVRKAFIGEPDASRFTPAQLDREIDLLENLILLSGKIANQQGSLSRRVADFGPAPDNVYQQVLHWPTVPEDQPEMRAIVNNVEKRVAEAGEDGAK